MSKLIKVCGKHTLGSIGDMVTEWWGEEEWKEWKELCDELRRTGEFGEEVDYCYEFIHNPELDDTHIIDSVKKGTAQFIIFDCSPENDKK